MSVMNLTVTTTALAFSPLDTPALLAILTPILIVPLGVITFCLRALRDQQSSIRSDLTRRIEGNEGELHRLTERVASFERDFATKEDWLRESMLARHNIERLSAAMARMETEANVLSRQHRQGASVTQRSQDRWMPYEGTD